MCLCPQVPVGFSNLTIRLHLDKNLLSYLPADSFSDLFLLTELDLSHNKVVSPLSVSPSHLDLNLVSSPQLSFLEAGCFRGLASTLHFLDLSSNRLSSLDPGVLGDLGALANLTHNPWHCDCKMQVGPVRTGGPGLGSWVSTETFPLFVFSCPCLCWIWTLRLWTKSSVKARTSQTSVRRPSTFSWSPQEIPHWEPWS